MALLYKWIPSSTACERCNQMAQSPHNSPPQKPHKGCVCTWVEINTNNRDSKNCSGTATIQRIAQTDEGEPVTENGVIVRIHLTFEVTGICPDNTIVTVNLSVTIDGQQEVDTVRQRIKDKLSSGQTLEDAMAPELDNAMDQARTEAMSIIRSECPVCEPRPSV